MDLPPPYSVVDPLFNSPQPISESSSSTSSAPEPAKFELMLFMPGYPETTWLRPVDSIASDTDERTTYVPKSACRSLGIGTGELKYTHVYFKLFKIQGDESVVWREAWFNLLRNGELGYSEDGSVRLGYNIV